MSGSEETTEKERLRAIYEMLFDRTPDSVAYSDSQGNLYVNQAGHDMMRRTITGPDVDGPDKWGQNYGLFLPDGVLRRIYRENALRLLPR